MTSVKQIVRFKKSIRTEPSSIVSEFNLAKTNKNKTEVGQLIGSLDKIKNVGELKKQLTTAKKRNNALATPLHKRAQEKIERKVAYEETKKRVGFWDEIVKKNRLADKLEFPLNQKSYASSTLESAIQRFQPRTPLEIESAKLLGQSKNNLTGDVEFTEAEKETLNAMSLDKAEKSKEKLCKIRALITYEAAKNRRKKNIKSKRYHRITKRQKRKETEKQFLKLLSENPAEAREKLELLEKDRIKERSTLKHRNTGKWAKQIRQLAKKDSKIREILQQQLRLGKELTEKIAAPESEDESTISEENLETPDEIGQPTAIDLQPKLAVLDFGDADDEDQQINLITEAFTDDDVLEEEIDEQMQKNNADESKNRPDEGELPGWNSWAGPGIWRKPKTKKEKILKHPQKKREIKIVMNEKMNDSIKKFQVKQIPFPFCEKDVFEANLSHPLGKEWNTDTSFKMLIEPTIKTKMGAVINPIDKKTIVRKKKRNFLEKRKKNDNESEEILL